MASVRVKICGITTPADANAAARLGANWLGLNFYPKSARCITPAVAATILRELPPSAEAVALFVNQSLAELRPTLDPLDIHTIQLHGEPREHADPRPYQIIPAFAVCDSGSLTEIRAYLDQCRYASWRPVAVLVDAHVPGQYGGTGQTAPWHLLADFDPGVPLILAGGLTPENVAEAVRVVRPYAVDVASGVELRPGVKDVEKMRRFIANAREAAASYDEKK